MTSHASYDDAVVGAGIVGLAHAYQLARRGRRVVVIERNARATGASIRNFGMLWPIGQPFGSMRALARLSLTHWLEVLGASGLWHDRCGSLHLAYHDDEAQVLGEYAAQSREAGEPVELLDAAQAAERARGIVRTGLKRALFSPSEVCVDPREVIAGLPDWLSRRFGVEFQFQATITTIDSPAIRSGSTQWKAARIWICSGDELGILYPERIAGLGLVRCKLQMMRSQPLADNPRIGPMLAAGLTLRHYASFARCPTLPLLRARFTREFPAMERYGIHVLVSQNGHGELTLGDSHEYEHQIEPFDKHEIEDCILSYLATFLDVPGVRIASRWHGTYAKHPREPYVVDRPSPGVTLVTGLGGAGMTLSFALADQMVARELGES